MRTAFTRVVLLALAITVMPAPAQAQWVVLDPANLAQSISQVTQLLKTYQWIVDQAKRLPAAILAKYITPEVQWRLHNLTTAYPLARPVLTALTSGDSTGLRYLQIVDAVQPVTSILTRLPPTLRKRVTDAYATIELADSVAQMSINQVGSIRTNGASVLNAINDLESDTLDVLDNYQSQTAILNKINGTNVLGLRIAERSTQFLMHTLEQLIVENKRQRDTEAILMNATIYQWQYGLSYGRDLYRSTAANLDSWRQY
jgi:hypothetical protein